MRKVVLFLLLFMFCTSAAASERIRPTIDIGLFIEPHLFWQGLQNTPLRSHIQGSNLYDYPYQSNLIKYIEEYYLEEDTTIITWINKYDKIHAIKIEVTPWYTMMDDCYDEYELTDFVLHAAGLMRHDDDLSAPIAIKNREDFHLGRNFTVERYVEDVYLYVEINNVYHVDASLTPYTIMNIFEGPCDPNYTGACVPVVNYDLDCSDLPVVNFFVTGTDKHRFDGDGNGVCCEPYPG